MPQPAALREVVLPFAQSYAGKIKLVAGPTTIQATNRRLISPILTGFREDYRTDILQPLGTNSPTATGGKMVSYVTTDILSPLTILSALMMDKSGIAHTAEEAISILDTSDAAFSPAQISAIIRGDSPGGKHLYDNGRSNMFPVLVEIKGEVVIRMFFVRFMNGAFRGHLSRVGYGRGTNPGAFLHLRNKIDV